MKTIVGVRFKQAGKIYYFAPGDLNIAVGNQVIVETARGLEFGEVVSGPKDVSDAESSHPLKAVIRIATEEDRRVHQQNKEKVPEAFRLCQERIDKHGLEMKLVDVEYTFDNNKIIFYFTADGRVDFRELVKDLAGVFRTRIELRQIGVRDEAKIVGGMGSCGRQLCCNSFLGEFAPVSIKMAKNQNLSLNPTKVSGVCGRLMCCLNYEHDHYVELLKELPKVNKMVDTPDGVGKVFDLDILRGKVKVRFRNERGPDQIVTFDAKEVSLYKKPEPKPKGKFESKIDLNAVDAFLDDLYEGESTQAGATAETDQDKDVQAEDQPKKMKLPQAKRDQIPTPSLNKKLTGKDGSDRSRSRGSNRRRGGRRRPNPKKSNPSGNKPQD